MVPFYSTLSKFVSSTGYILAPWIQYLQQFTIAPPPFMDIVVSASPFSYEAAEPGFLYISGGTVSNITLTRGSETIVVAVSTATPRFVPLGINDTVTITYSVLPTVKFIPNYGQNTTI